MKVEGEFKMIIEVEGRSCRIPLDSIFINEHGTVKFNIPYHSNTYLKEWLLKSSTGEKMSSPLDQFHIVNRQDEK